jgi:Ni/Co efflux regulator RcnB
MKLKTILIAASALTLAGGPAAMAQHHQRDHRGSHAAQARHGGGGSQRARAAHTRRAESRRPARRVEARRDRTRGVTSRRARDRYDSVRGRNQSRRYAAVRSGGGGARHWRHVSRLNGRWGRGSRLPVSYWRSHRYVDWRAHRLWAPPRGYNWVSVNGNYVLLAITTGLIADIVLANSYY